MCWTEAHEQREDIPVFFAQQLDADANRMAAFTSQDPTDKTAFMAYWATIRGDDSVTTKTIVVDAKVAGHILRFDEADHPEVSYWLGKDYWGQGIATRALTVFLGQVRERPLYARAVKDNGASLRVLQTCGFTIVGEDAGAATRRHAGAGTHGARRR